MPVSDTLADPTAEPNTWKATVLDPWVEDVADTIATLEAGGTSLAGELRIGGAGEPRTSTTINDALQSLLGTGTLGGTVILDGGDVWTISASILVPSRCRLLGVASTPDYVAANDFGGTMLVAATNLNAPVIRTSGTETGGAAADGTTDFWHGGEIAYLTIAGNQANQSGTALQNVGLHIGQMGDVSSVHDVYVADCKGDGVVIDYLSLPSFVRDVNSRNNGGHGFHLRNVDRHVTLINPSADENAGAGICLSDSTNVFQACSVTIINPKIEGGLGEHESGILLDDWGGSLVVLGGLVYSHASRTGTGDAAIRRTGTQAGDITVIQLRSALYDTLFDDGSER